MTSSKAANGDATEVEVAIAGSGFSGLGMAIKLEQSGRRDFVVLEREADVGGTWWNNTYPGCGCDVPSHLYSFSFAPNPNWSRTYSRQPEISEYLRGVADRAGVRQYIRFGCEVGDTAWDEDERRWRIQTSKGEVRARILISALGPLDQPNVPALPGLAEFEGRVFHSARWDHDYDLRGKRVASIGTGASAIQYVPMIQPEVERLHVFQRTPPWMMPHTDRPVSALERRIYRRFPPAQRAVRGLTYLLREWLVIAFVKQPRLMPLIERIARRHIRSQVPDPEMRRKVTPSYTIGCKRILPSNKWYPALSEPNVELVAGGVKEVRRSSVVGDDGVEREVDAIIFGTGFQVTRPPVGKQVRGRGGRTMDEVWGGVARAHLGATLAGFPNLFLLLGPNTGLGHNSMIYMIESQIAYVMDALRVMESRGAETVEVRADVEADYNERLQEDLEDTVWNTGCASWYVTEDGKNPTVWPDWTWRFRRRTAELDATEFEFDAATPERATATA